MVGLARPGCISQRVSRVYEAVQLKVLDSKPIFADPLRQAGLKECHHQIFTSLPSSQTHMTVCNVGMPF